MKKHMPLVQEKWGPHGLQNWTVSELDGKDGWSVYVFSACFLVVLNHYIHYLSESLCMSMDRGMVDVIEM
jgi:hypothetical protein